MIRVVLDGLVRPVRKPKPAHRQRRFYVTADVATGLAVEKPLPEETWQSVKKAAGIEGTFVPPKADAAK